tara:strand:+ start:3709 stop:3843 length:135 start_codon:yes stop_codon:yes gene_type:complete
MLLFTIGFNVSVSAQASSEVRAEKTVQRAFDKVNPVTNLSETEK